MPVGGDRVADFVKVRLRDDPLRKGQGGEVGTMLAFHTPSGVVPGILIGADEHCLTIASSLDVAPKAVPASARYVTVLPIDQILRVDVFCAAVDDWPPGWVGRKGQLGFTQPEGIPDGSREKH